LRKPHKESGKPHEVLVKPDEETPKPHQVSAIPHEETPKPHEVFPILDEKTPFLSGDFWFKRLKKRVLGGNRLKSRSSGSEMVVGFAIYPKPCARITASLANRHLQTRPDHHRLEQMISIVSSGNKSVGAAFRSRPASPTSNHTPR
jgi:hypothetical protein